jgi:predicted transcriptional regulator
MATAKNPVPPTRAELRILQALWELSSGTIEEIIHHKSFSSPPNYKTTEGRVFVFEPAVSRESVERLSVRTLLEQNFGGSPAKLLVNLLESGPVKENELEELEALIRNYRILKGELPH